MKYIALLYSEAGAAGPGPGTPEFNQMMDDYQSATQAMADAGVLVDSGPLQSAEAATTVRIRNGETQLSDGPFAEIKEQLGGYYILDCDDLDTALRYAATIPAAKYGSVEVRPLMAMGPA
ncbi:MAG: YciI family protein [Acidimicrobiaceae bacterium]|nr:YciI family protein [Acidimicrobiaceae bacterium]